MKTIDDLYKDVRAGKCKHLSDGSLSGRVHHGTDYYMALRTESGNYVVIYKRIDHLVMAFKYMIENGYIGILSEFFIKVSSGGSVHAEPYKRLGYKSIDQVDQRNYMPFAKYMSNLIKTLSVVPSFTKAVEIN